MVPPASHRVSRVRRYSGSSPLRNRFRLQGSHLLWRAFPDPSSNHFSLLDCPQPQRINPLVCPLPRSLATTCGISVDFSSSPYLDVSVQAVPRVRLFCSTHADRVLLCRVSPFGNLRIKGYVHLPRLIAACHVLLRLLMPRHSPCALFSLTYFLVNKKGLALVLIEFELCRLQSSLKLFVLPLKSSTKICCFPLLLALHTLVTLFSFQGAVLVSLETRFKHLAILNA